MSAQLNCIIIIILFVNVKDIFYSFDLNYLWRRLTEAYTVVIQRWHLLEITKLEFMTYLLNFSICFFIECWMMIL